MRSVAAVLLLACFCNAKPMLNLDVPIASFGRLGIDNQIIGGQDASPGEWPWQLSQERASGSTWSHSCGASLLSSTAALSAAHCVDATPVANIRVIAGLHLRSDTTGTQTSDALDYVKHEQYEAGTETYANDISIIHLVTAITVNGGSIQLLTLPPDNTNNFLGVISTITGWGRTSGSNVLPNTLQEAQIEIIGTAECDTLMRGVIGVTVWDNHLCLYDRANNIGSCNGDSGGPNNVPNGSGFYVAGITSWGVSSGGNCLQTYPSVYTRTSAYLQWISDNA